MAYKPTWNTEKYCDFILRNKLLIKSSTVRDLKIEHFMKYLAVFFFFKDFPVSIIEMIYNCAIKPFEIVLIEKKNFFCL